MSAKFVWKKNPYALGGRLEGVVKERTFEIAKQLFDGIVARTPVRTGSARASWTASIGSPSWIVRRNSDPLSPLGPPSFPLTAVPAFEKVYISNATPYIMPLEYGWSKQAPAGMVRVTLASLGIGLSVRR